MTDRPTAPDAEALHDEDDCTRCRDCPGCDGGSGVTPKRWQLVPFPAGKYASVCCIDCDGAAVVCDCTCHVVAAAALAADGDRGVR